MRCFETPQGKECDIDVALYARRCWIGDDPRLLLGIDDYDECPGGGLMTNAGYEEALVRAGARALAYARAIGWRERL